ncbi:MAG: hypothetical protein PW789_04940 [Edaphobacter sp.]|uniref:hypothetical protein n=1 Tax=Edaphobacter sp. TaxID=1934404 RepID=UPI00238F2CB2|nr:hypothetical protein [Edaphobacter sp.]MDE1175934.1 hypothetical protein [Edaphobacter sp.]
MDISEIIGTELNAVEFVQDYLQLRFEAPMLTFYAWPHILFSDFSLAYGEPEYRNALCSLIGEKVEEATLEEGDSLTVKFENDTVIALSLREEDLDGPQAGAYSDSGLTTDQIEF